MLIIAVDPGVATGLVVWDHDMREILEALTLDQFETCSKLEDLLTADYEEYLVIERYNITTETIKKTRQTASLEIIGVARYFADNYSHPFIMQNASDAKDFITDSKLRKLGWWDRSDHIRDAMRHLGLYLAKNLHDKEVLLAGTG